MNVLGIAKDNREMIMKEIKNILISPYPEYSEALSIEIIKNDDVNSSEPIKLKIKTGGIIKEYKIISYFQLEEG